MLNGNWLLSHEGIAFDAKGQLIDGQHRLHAINWANEAQPGFALTIMVFTDCDAKSIRLVNTGAPRAAHDQLRMLGIGPAGNHCRIASMARAMLAGLRWKTGDISVDTVLRCVEKYGDTMEWVYETAGRGLRRSPAYAVAVKATIEYGEKVMKPFCEQVECGAFNGAGDPAWMLYKFLHKTSRVTPTYMETYGKSVTAVRWHLNGVSGKAQLSASATDIALPYMLEEFCPELKNDKDSSD